MNTTEQLLREALNLLDRHRGDTFSSNSLGLYRDNVDFTKKAERFLLSAPVSVEKTGEMDIPILEPRHAKKADDLIKIVRNALNFGPDDLSESALNQAVALELHDYGMSLPVPSTAEQEDKP